MSLVLPPIAAPWWAITVLAVRPCPGRASGWPAGMHRIRHAKDSGLGPETVNPHFPPALRTFWLNLTHVRPLFPESLLFLARECGFRSGRIFFPMGTGDLDADLRTCGEYALIAIKPHTSNE